VKPLAHPSNEGTRSYPLISNEDPLILASESPRRRHLLSQLGLPFRVAPSHMDEVCVGNSPEAMCCRLAEGKALQVYSTSRPSWVLGADTAVVIEGKVLGKPQNHEDAKMMLSLLGGREHTVVTGFCILDPSGRPVHTEAVSTAVRFKPLNDTEIEAYIQTGEPFGKAGAYAIQRVGAFMVESICGSYTNVVGLPICAVIKALIRVAAIPRFPLGPS